MCGIYGAVALGAEPLREPHHLERIGRLLRHRGPDAHGLKMAPRAALGAERLRVIDLTPAGDQPLCDPAEQVWLVLNGAIYNATELRRRYASYPFRSQSDTETVLPLYMHEGHAGLAQLDGMFALAIYDTRTQELHLARDRAGEKPLFYCSIRSEIWFASEVQALLEIPGVSRALDVAAVRDFVTLGYVTEPRTMHQQIRRVESGTVLSATGQGQRTHRYWDPNDVVIGELSSSKATERLDSLLSESVAKQLVADVPIGIFTSGGVDSALIAAFAAQAAAPEQVHTLSVGFKARPFDESRHARSIASLIGTRHTEVTADERSLSQALDAVVRRVAEPIADPAILPTYLLAREARNHVAVVLSGEGADELFGGYPTYLGHRVTRWYGRLPGFVRNAMAHAVSHLPASQRRKVPLEYLLRRFAEAAELPLTARHRQWFGTGVGDRVLGPALRDQDYEPPPFPTTGDAIDRTALFDYRTYLRDNLLPKVDRATMLSSVEARAPYLDSEVTRFALALDSSFKVRGLTAKWLLKQVACRHLPRTVVHRRKRGLSVPVAEWLNAGLRSEADRLLAPEHIRRQGLLQPEVVSQLVSEHRCGRANHGRALWALLMLEYWLGHWVSED